MVVLVFVLVLVFVWAVDALLVSAVASTLGLKRKQERSLLALLPQVRLYVHQVRLDVVRVGAWHWALLPPVPLEVVRASHWDLLLLRVRQDGVGASHSALLPPILHAHLVAGHIRCVGDRWVHAAEHQLSLLLSFLSGSRRRHISLHSPSVGTRDAVRIYLFPQGMVRKCLVQEDEALVNTICMVTGMLSGVEWLALLLHLVIDGAVADTHAFPHYIRISGVCVSARCM